MSRWFWLMCLVVGLWFTPQLAMAQQPSTGSGPEQYEGRRVESVEVQGNRRVERQSILGQVRTKKGNELDLRRVGEDLRRIWRLGYFEDIQVDARTVKGGRVVLTFIVKEKPAIASITFEGNDELSKDDIDDVVDLRKFQILDIAKVKANAEKIRELYLEKGYYLAEVTYKLRRDGQFKDQSHVTFQIREYAKVQVKRVTFLGNKALSDDELSQIMATRQGDWFSFMTSFGNFKEEAFEADLQRLTAYYYDKGFVQVQVGLPTIRLSKDKRYLFITIKIKEGPRFSVGDVDLQGDFITKKEKLLDKIKLKKGDKFSYGTLRQDMERLRNFYRDAGYAYANVNPLTRVDPEEKVVHTTYDIQKGNKVYFGRITVVGNTKTRDKVIRRELVIEEGKLFSSKDIVTSKQRIQRLGFFETVELTTQRGERDDIINATVRVVERPTGTFQAGAGFSSTENILANVQIAQNNLFGRGQALTFQFQWSGLRTLFNLRFSEPRLFDSLWRFSSSGYNFDFQYRDYSQTSTGGNVTFGYPLLESAKSARDLSISATYKLENVALRPNQSARSQGAAQSTLFRGGLTSSVALSMLYDDRNNRIFPTKGSFHSARLEFADDLITGSQNEYLKGDVETRWYFPMPVFPQFVLKLNAKLGYVASVDGSVPVPLQERYLVGGPDTVRGFQRFSLGPRETVASDPTDPGSSTTSFTLGGDKQLLLTAEMEFPIFTALNLRGVFFADAGNAFGEDETFSLVPDLLADDVNEYSDALRTGVGFGFRWFSPIGLLRFEWGIPLSRLRTEDPLVFEFSIGNGF